MRVRKKKNLVKRLESCEGYLVQADEAKPGGWRPEGFTELRLEIGCGKGKFVTTLAAENPGVFFVALERERDVLVMAAEKAKALGLGNLRFFAGDAANLAEFFAAGEISAIYINFCDPWPKSRHAKRRLTHRSFLGLYRRVLSDAGRIFFKTDGEALFEFTLGELSASGYVVDFMSRDLGRDRPDGVKTEYEERFLSQGMPIYAVDATLSAEPHGLAVEGE